jgi:hypothetical protein
MLLKITGIAPEKYMHAVGNNKVHQIKNFDTK